MARRRRAATASEFACPHCGERIDTAPDPGGGETQEYIEDCPVCCRANRIFASYSPEDDAYSVNASGEV